MATTDTNNTWQSPRGGVHVFKHSLSQTSHGLDQDYSDHKCATKWLSDSEQAAARMKARDDAKEKFASARSEAAANKHVTFVNGSWDGHDAHPSTNNPQYCLKLPVINTPGKTGVMAYADGNGKHTIEVKATRLDGGKEAITLSLYKSFGGKLMQALDPKLLVAESEATKDRSSTSVDAEVVGGLYIVILSLSKPGIKGDFKITVTTDKEEPKLTGLMKQSVVRRSQWDPAKGRCGGYGKAANPQFVLGIPEGTHQLQVALTRVDKKTDQGMIFWIFEHDGDKSQLAQVATGNAIGSSPFLKGHTVDEKFTLKQGSYLVLCSIQATDSEAKFTLTATLEGRAVPTLDEITAGGAPAAAAPPAAVKKAATVAVAKPTGPSVTGKWTAEGDLSGGYQKVDNPQILLSVQGDGETSLQIEKLEGGKENGMICFVYRLTNEEANGYRFKKLPAKNSVVAQTKFQKESCLDCKWEKMTKDKQHYLLLPCLQSPGVELDFKVSISNDGAGARSSLKFLTEYGPSTAAICEGEWTAEFSGGYQKPENPQFLMTVKSKSMVKVALERTDGKKDEGMICTIYRSPPGFAGGRVEGLSGSKAAVNKTPYKISAGPLEVSWVALPGTYVVVPSLKTKGVTGPFAVSADGFSKPTLEPIVP